MVLQKQIKLSDYYVKKNGNTISQDGNNVTAANKNVATDGSGNVIFEEKNNHNHDATYIKKTDVDSSLSNSSSNPVQNQVVKSALDGKSDTGHTHSGYAATNHEHSQYLTSESLTRKEDTSNKVSSWSTTTTDTHYPSEKLVKDSLDGKVNTNDSRLTDARTPTSHTHTKSQITDFPNIPSASSITPSADITNGAIGNSSNYAKADHQHPLSSAYATSGHSHTGMLTSSDVGTSSDTSSSKIVACNDTRLSNARTPTSHTHTYGNITGVNTVQVLVTYTDDTTETLNLLKYTGS